MVEEKNNGELWIKEQVIEIRYQSEKAYEFMRQLVIGEIFFRRSLGIWEEEGDMNLIELHGFFSREKLQSMIKYYELFYHALKFFEYDIVDMLLE